MADPGEPIIGQSPHRKVGNSTYITVPGPVPVIKARREERSTVDDLITFLRQCLDAEGQWAEESKTDFYVGDCAQRLLLDVAAKRRILDGPLTGSGPDQYTEWEWTLKVLALCYVDHPEFREEWKL